MFSTLSFLNEKKKTVHHYFWDWNERAGVVASKQWRQQQHNMQAKGTHSSFYINSYFHLQWIPINSARFVHRREGDAQNFATKWQGEIVCIQVECRLKWTRTSVSGVKSHIPTSLLLWLSNFYVQFSHSDFDIANQRTAESECEWINTSHLWATTLLRCLCSLSLEKKKKQQKTLFKWSKCVSSHSFFTLKQSKMNKKPENMIENDSKFPF